MPSGSVTPSLIEPVISAPAQVVSRITLPSMDTTDGITWASDGRLIIDGYGAIWLYDDLTASPRSIPTDADGAVDVAVSADGRLLLVLGWDGSLALWDVATASQLSRMASGPLWDRLQFNPDQLEVVSRLQNGVVTIDANNQLVMGDPLPQVDSEANYYYLNPADPSQLINYTYTGRVIVSTREGQIINSFGEENPNAFPRSVAFNVDGTLMALGQDDGFIRIYEIGTGKLVTTMSHNGRVYDLSFSPDGRYISAMIETSPVYTLWMWNLESNLQYAAVVHDLPLIGPAFNAAGDQLAISTIDGRVLILDVTMYP
jgi:WD40 repeat protein